MAQRSNFEGRPEEALVKKRAIDRRYYHNNKERLNAKKRADRLEKNLRASLAECVVDGPIDNRESYISR
jgi:hypothetical protein